MPSLHRPVGPASSERPLRLLSRYPDHGHRGFLRQAAPRLPGRRRREGRGPGPGDLDGVPIGVGDEGVGQPRRVLTPLDQPAAGLLGPVHRLIDGCGGGLGQVDAEVLDPALLPGPGAVVHGPGQVQGQ